MKRKPKFSTSDKLNQQEAVVPLSTGDIVRYSIGEVLGIVFVYHFTKKIYHFATSGEIHFRFRFGYEVDGLPACIISLLLILIGGFLIYFCSYDLYRHCKRRFFTGNPE